MFDVRWLGDSVPGSFFAAEDFRNFAELVDAWAASDPGLLAFFGGSSLTEKSHGQCNMAFFENRFRVPGLYLLDEPESALSPRRQLELRRILVDASARGDAQFVVATHSPILLSLAGSTILSFDSSPVAEVAYQDTDSYRLHHTTQTKGAIKGFAAARVASGHTYVAWVAIEGQTTFHYMPHDPGFCETPTHPAKCGCVVTSITNNTMSLVLTRADAGEEAMRFQLDTGPAGIGTSLGLAARGDTLLLAVAPPNTTTAEYRYLEIDTTRLPK